jgi:amino acid transporter
MDDNSLEQRILLKVDLINKHIRSNKKFVPIKKVSLILMILSPIWLPILFTTLGASMGCCKRNELGLWFFGAGPVILSFFMGIWGLFKLKSNIGLIAIYSLVSIFLLFFIGWGSLLNLGVGP